MIFRQYHREIPHPKGATGFPLDKRRVLRHINSHLRHFLNQNGRQHEQIMKNGAQRLIFSVISYAPLRTRGAYAHIRDLLRYYFNFRSMKQQNRFAASRSEIIQSSTLTLNLPYEFWINSILVLK